MAEQVTSNAAERAPKPFAELTPPEKTWAVLAEFARIPIKGTTEPLTRNLIVDYTEVRFDQLPDAEEQRQAVNAVFDDPRVQRKTHPTFGETYWISPEEQDAVLSGMGTDLQTVTAHIAEHMWRSIGMDEL